MNQALIDDVERQLFAQGIRLVDHQNGMALTFNFDEEQWQVNTFSVGEDGTVTVAPMPDFIFTKVCGVE